MTWLRIFDLNGELSLILLDNAAMADSSESRPVVKSTKPVSEALLNEKVSADPQSKLHIRVYTLLAFDSYVSYPK